MPHKNHPLSSLHDLNVKFDWQKFDIDKFLADREKLGRMRKTENEGDEHERHSICE